MQQIQRNFEVDRAHNGSSPRQRVSFVNPAKNSHHSAAHDSTSKTPSKRQVSFNRSVAVRSALHRNDYKVEEFQAVWYSQEETTKIYFEAKQLVKKLNKKSPMDEQELLSTRGLECRTQEGNVKKTEMRQLSKTLVKEEQARQWQSGIQDPDFLAMVYSTVSHQAQDEATQRGRLDELAAHLYR